MSSKKRNDSVAASDGSKPVKTSKIKKMMKGLSRKKKKSSSSVSEAMSTAVSVQADEMSTFSTAVPGSKAVAGTAVTLQLVLLLMDPTTRRFELLQLEFDSDKARVSDILAQIPISVTEPSIRTQQYEGVIDATGTTMSEFVRLIDFCKGKTVLVALPKGLTVKDCTRLARPILCDKQVERMLSSGQFDISEWKKKDDKSKSRAIPETSTAAPVAKPTKTPTSKKPKESSIFPTIALLALIAVLIQAAHIFLSAPIQPGASLKPGTWKSKCGVFGLFPPMPLEKVPIIPPCDNLFMEVHSDGTVSIKDDSKELEVHMKGGECPKDDDACVDGLVVLEDGQILIGGEPVKTASVYGETSALTPWPFQEDPKIKLKATSRH